MFFGADAKPLLFINDDQAEIFEFDVFAQEPMGADEDVDFSFRDLRGFFSLLCGLETRDGFNDDRMDLTSVRKKFRSAACASTVVGTRTATCFFPSATALKAARMATSVFP